MSIWRKLTTKPVWYLETRRSYPIRRDRKLFSPIRADQGPAIFVIMATPGTLDEAIWCAWSWLRFIAHEVRLAIYIDGPVGTEERQIVEGLFPGCTITDARPIAAEMDGLFPAAQGFYSLHIHGRKLAVLLRLQKGERVFYSDFDVLAFSPPFEIVTHIKDAKAGVYIQEENKGAFDPSVLSSAKKIGLTPLSLLNSGLLVIPKESLSFDLAHILLDNWRSCRTWWIEQTILACLLNTVPMVPLPEDRYVTAKSRQFYWQKDVDYRQIAARHFVSPIRHVMYLKGMAWLMRDARKS